MAALQREVAGAAVRLLDATRDQVHLSALM